MEFNRRRFDLSQDPEFQINFDYIEKFTVRDVDTDLASVTIRGDLLFKNVSFLKDPVKIKLQIPLTALAQEFEIEAQLPDTVEAKMDGWGLAITAMAFTFAASKRRTPSVAKLTLKGILNLGVDGSLAADRKRVGPGQSVSGSVDLGCRRNHK